MTRTIAIALVALALGACATDSRPSPAASAMPHGTIDAAKSAYAPNAVAFNCPEQDPAQPGCRVPKYANVGDLIDGETLVPR